MKFYLLVIGVMSMTWSLTAQNSVENREKDRLKPPEILTKIDLLKYMEIDGHRITFRKVQNDGRCPEEVTCVWPGEARLVLEIYNGEEEVTHPVILPAQGTHKEILTTEKYRVYLKNLEPYPATQEDKIEAYQLVVKVEQRKTE